MQLHDILDVLRAEFAQAADEIDAALAAWTEGAPDEDPAPHGEAAAATFDRLATVSRMVGLEGAARVVHRVDLSELVQRLKICGRASRTRRRPCVRSSPVAPEWWIRGSR